MLATVALVSLLVVTAAFSATRWRVALRADSRGLPWATAHAIVKHPNALAVRFVGGEMRSGLVVGDCVRGSRRVNWGNLNFGGPGFYRLGIPRHAARCEVVATVRGKGPMGVVILRRG